MRVDPIARELDWVNDESKKIGIKPISLLEATP